MKRCIILLALVSLTLSSCYTTRIVTVSPDTRYHSAYSTTVSVAKTPVVTTTTHVTALSEDISLCLDLQAVGAAFAQSATVEEFENLLNNSSYMLSNLDLNRDGYVDYLRVLETVQGNAHVFVIQAVLADNVYQDVATLVAEVTSTYATSCVQVIGAPYIYGPNFIIEPVFMATPVIYRHLVRPYYNPWRSPWYWGHYPPCYRHPAPIYINHYHAYVNTYMQSHRYCHEFRYAPQCHYPDYERVSRPVQRDDYGKQYPERSFISRTANVPAQSGSSAGPARTVYNAKDIRESVNSTSRTSVENTGGAVHNSRTSSQSASSQSTSSTVKKQGESAQSQASKTPAASSSRAASSSSSSSSTPRTTVQSDIRTSGSSSTKISTVSPSGTTTTSRRTDVTTSSSRSSASSSSSRSSGSTTSSSRSSASSSTPSYSRSSTGSSSSSAASSSSRSSSSSSSRSSSSSSSSRAGSSSSSRSGGSASSSRSSSSRR